MHHLGQVVFFRVAGHFINQYIRQQHGKRVVTDQRTGTQHSVAQTFGLALADVHDGDVFRADLLHLFQQLTLDSLLEGRFQFETLVEVVFDGVLARVGDQHDLLDTGGDGFAHYVLDQWFVDHRQHLFRDGLGGWQHTGTQTGYREHGLANCQRSLFHGKLSSGIKVRP